MSNQLLVLKERLRAIERKADQYSILIAKKLDLPKVWAFNMIDVDDPLIANEYMLYREAMEEYNKIYWKIAELEHDENNPRKNYHARKQVNNFLNSLGDSKEACLFLQSINMTTHELIERVAVQPDFLDGAFL